jgi:hypothetical protein
MFEPQSIHLKNAPTIEQDGFVNYQCHGRTRLGSLYDANANASPKGLALDLQQRNVGPSNLFFFK